MVVQGLAFLSGSHSDVGFLAAQKIMVGRQMSTFVGHRQPDSSRLACL